MQPSPLVSRLSLINIIYLLGVIVFGAFVRATGSGAGCGAHWPLCNGEVIPPAPQMQTIIEFTHRITSGLSLPLALLVAFFAWRRLPQKHPSIKFAWLTVLFVIIEGLVGAGLVLFEHVADNMSKYRAFSMSVHLISTFTLMAFAMLAFVYSRSSQWKAHNKSPRVWIYQLGLGLLVFSGLSGAITALGDTLFPVQNLNEALALGLDATSHLIVQLRIYHPFIAVFTGVFLLLYTKSLYFRIREAQTLALLVSGVVLIQLALGYLNVYLMAPVWLQLIHLLIAELIWIHYIALGARSFRVPLTEKP